MTRTTGRVLRLLTLLQGRRVWTSAELSERLRVDTRTIRRDVDRLRELGYQIEASSGPGGGYRLGAGSATPPLLLEDEVQSQPPPTRGTRFSPRPLPEDAASFVSRSIAAAPHRYVAHVRLAAPAEEVSSRLPPWLGAPESIDERSCRLTIGAETVEIIAAYIVQAGVDFVLLGPPEIIEPLRAVTRRMQRAMDESPFPAGPPEGSPADSGGLGTASATTA